MSVSSGDRDSETCGRRLEIESIIRIINPLSHKTGSIRAEIEILPGTKSSGTRTSCRAGREGDFIWPRIFPGRFISLLVARFGQCMPNRTLHY